MSAVDSLRRCDTERMQPAELAILEAVKAVERMPADGRLTHAVFLLDRARNAVADYIDGIYPQPVSPVAEPSEGDRTTWVDTASGETGPAEFRAGEWRER